MFYGNVKGWISQKGMGNEVTEPSRYFFIGQVVSKKTDFFIYKIFVKIEFSISVFISGESVYLEIRKSTSLPEFIPASG